mgnify:FL=1
MSDLNATEPVNNSDNIETLLVQFQNLLNSENSIAEISAEINALTEQIERHFKAEDLKNEEVDSQPHESADNDKTKSDTHEQWDRLSRTYRKKRRKYYEERNKDLQENLNKRLALIESFKGLLTIEENITHTLKTFKALQEEWYAAGPIAKNDYEMVWQTYRHHVENFYDYLDLNREFRDLDFKYNYDQKLRIIARAQELVSMEDQNMAFKELQKLHKIWKEDIGPVAKEHREPLWQTFSEVTKVMHDKRQTFFQEREAQQIDNLTRKKAIVTEIAAIAEQNDQDHKLWQKSVKRVQKLRDEFFDIGPVPKKENKTLWSDFKKVTKQFNQVKNSFFKDQKKQHMANLNAKKELILLAEQHLASGNFEESTPLMKKIQADWRKIGPVPHRDSDKIWKRFKAACNAYFDKLHNEQKAENASEQKALVKKKSILKTLSDKKKSSFKSLEDIKLEVDQWYASGKISAKTTGLENEFFDCIKTHLMHLGQTAHQAEMTSFTLKIEGLVTQNQEQLLQQHGQLVEQKIKDLKSEINLLENNLGFFQNVAQNNPLLQEVHANMAAHRDDLTLWQEKKEILRRL